MKKLFLLLIAGLFAESSFCQTAIIAHKSHSGTAENFAFADPANYGGPPLMIERIVRVNDTVAAAETNGMGPRTLLIINNHELQDSLRDSITVLHMREYELDIMMSRDTNAVMIPLEPNETPQQRLDSIRRERMTPQLQEKTPGLKDTRKQKKSVLYFGLLLVASLFFGWLRKILGRA